AHRLLRFAQGYFLPFETVQWRMKRTVREGGEPRHAHVDAHRAALRQGHFDIASRLDRHMPLAARLADRDVAQLAQHTPAVTVAQPAQLGQEDAAVVLIELDLLRVGIAEAVVLTFALEARKVGAFPKEVL